MPEFPSEKIAVSNSELATKIGLFVMTAGLFLAGILAVIIMVGSIFYLSDQGRQDARIDQPNMQSLADDPKRDSL
jgi:hypothetical protein